MAFYISDFLVMTNIIYTKYFLVCCVFFLKVLLLCAPFFSFATCRNSHVEWEESVGIRLATPESLRKFALIAKLKTLF